MGRKKVYSEAERAAQREYYRKWRSDNREKVRASNKRYWAKRASKMAEVENESTEGV